MALYFLILMPVFPCKELVFPSPLRSPSPSVCPLCQSMSGAPTRAPSNNRSHWELSEGLAAAFLKTSLGTSWDLIVPICPLLFNDAINVAEAQVIWGNLSSLSLPRNKSLSATGLLLTSPSGLLNRKDFSVLPPTLSGGSTAGWEGAGTVWLGAHGVCRCCSVHTKDLRERALSCWTALSLNQQSQNEPSSHRHEEKRFLSDPINSFYAAIIPENHFCLYKKIGMTKSSDSILGQDGHSAGLVLLWGTVNSLNLQYSSCHACGSSLTAMGHL